MFVFCSGTCNKSQQAPRLKSSYLFSMQSKFKEEEPTWFQIALQDKNSEFLDVGSTSAAGGASASASQTAPSQKEMRAATKSQTIAALRTIRDGCIDQANGIAMLIGVRSTLVALKKNFSVH